MADHTPSLESSQLLSPDLPLMTSPPPPSMVNGDGPQQVILVQVNPGEAFTIRREDGQFQCITGPAQVPMMSPNGSVPPIYVPPGYVSQIIEENGVRRVLVLPQPEYHPGGHSPLHGPPPPPPHAHLPAFIPHPAMIPPPPHPMYSGVAGGAVDMGSQYIPQYHAAHLFSEQVSTDSHSPHGRQQLVHRDERASKTYERLQKKLKERQGGGGGGGPAKDRPNSPPPSPQKNHCSPTTVDVHNGVGGKGEHEQWQASAAGAGKDKQAGKTKGSPYIETEPEELDEESKALQSLLSTLSKPVVTDIQARTALLTWTAPEAPKSEDGSMEDHGSSLQTLSYEITVSSSGKDGKYKTVYSGEEVSATIEDLRPATDYHARVQAVCNCLQGSPSEAVSFTTLSCEPDTPSPPRKTSGTKSTLVLQWKAPCDNGSKIQNYVLQWDEGKGTGEFEQCYYGPQKQYRVTKLSPASRYSFRLAAKNDMGISGFSEAIDLYTSGSVPAPPPSPELVKAGVTWLCLRWQRPTSSPGDDEISYVLDMEEEGSGYGFQPRYDGDEVSCTIRNLHRSTKYKFRVSAYNAEGKSGPSQVAEFTTCPDRPSSPCRPAVRGKVHPNSFRMSWEPPNDDGGSEVTEYIVEISEGTTGASWEQMYRGSAMEYMCDGLAPGSCYQARVYCINEGGQSPLSDMLQVQTPPVPPGPCLPPRLVGKPKAREVQLRWGPPQVDGGRPVSCYSLEVCEVQAQEHREVYQGPELDCTVTSLLPGRTYSFRLRAANKAGFGPFSESCEVTTGPGAPEPCKAPHVVCKSPTCALISWECPPCNGAQVSEFRVEWGAAEGNMQVCYSGIGLSHEMKGLNPATIYFCRIQAVNVAGAGPFSEVTLCQTPCSVPAAVSSVQALREEEWGDETAKDREEGCEPAPSRQCPSSCLGLRWEPPCDHGAEITSYLIDLGERQPIAVGPVTRYIIQHLQPDTSYRIRIQALNSLGAGPFSHTLKLKTKPLPPEPPRLECTAFSHQTLRLKWGEGSAKAAPSDSFQYHLQMEDKNGRFISLYRGPCHTHKVQRLMESTSYTFRIQAFNEAGEGPFSRVYTFTTPRSPPAPLKAPRIERLDDHTCEVSWEALPPMKGDPIVYTLQCMMGNSEFKQVYKGSATSFQVPGLQPSCEYRFRVCAIRQCQTPPDLTGPYSASVTLSSQRSEVGAGVGGAAPRGGVAEAGRAKRSLTDEQCAALILVLFAIISILIAFVIQYFVIK
ncbi:fibronectin type-III domain-containing protein 3a-like isoform X2 [Megalops cyprinoides]|nr:fibronectin type-III domain-containing protein 3a-like isoform X2 [Megalops cyprinoides]XP_036392401.1 fibronectin type-III domain-containing protein 3a-like isoform X2 [Megalops cyprinoides]XP_036392402.1 fibronectin type-III domain-containing protein 3a-like isoform X2 [Megalops cyprinoides]XP_036392403.1 fibronectin type-III domain-containing protein 3a-like isoform X2 [Megalops cyprinoides]XP_036392404.1 fibronectin type-III domain-containing protein 3a-like isoform X2 [Megalops cyprinoi